MDTVTERPYRPDDAPAIAALLDEMERHAGGRGGWDAEEIATVFRTLVKDTERDSRLLFDGDGTLLAVAAVPSPPDGGFRVDGYGGVKPAARGHGHGRDLLGWLIERASGLHRESGAGRPWELHLTCGAADVSAIRLYRRFGLEPVRYWFEMIAPTAGAPTLPLPAGLRSEAYRPGFEKDVHAAHMAAFADHWGYQSRSLPEWVELTVGSSLFLPELSRVAFDGDKVAGYVLSYRHTDPEEVYIGHVGVLRAWRRRGIAAALMSEVLAAAGAAGMRRASLGVDADSPTGAVGVYERAGFHTDERYVTFARAV